MPRNKSDGEKSPINGSQRVRNEEMTQVKLRQERRLAGTPFRPHTFILRDEHRKRSRAVAREYHVSFMGLRRHFKFRRRSGARSPRLCAGLPVAIYTVMSR